MATQPKAGVPTVASLQELEKLNNDSAFIVNCLKQEMTMDQARDELIANQSSKIAELEGIVADQQEQINNAADSQAKIDTLRRQAGAQIPDPGVAQQQQAAADAQPAPAVTQPPVAELVPEPPSDIGNSAITLPVDTAHNRDEFNGNPLAFFNQAKQEIVAEKPDINPAHLVAAIHNKYPNLDAAMRAQAQSRQN